MNACYIVDAVRSPIGKYGGQLSIVRPDDLMATVIRSLVARNATIDLNTIEDVIIGCANQAGEDCRNIGRMAALLAQLPVSVAGNTVNRLCASGMQAIMDAAKSIMCGHGLMYIAGGVESMSRAPMVSHKKKVSWTQDDTIYDTTIGWRFTNQNLTKQYAPLSMGETAEIIATRYRIDRLLQDEYTLHSHLKYFHAQANYKWQNEIVTINVHERPAVSTDENPRQTSIEQLSRLKPLFNTNGTVTAGNASALNDGASALLLASEEALQRFNLRPIARIVSMGISGIHPDMMGLGPVHASQKALKQAGLHMHQIEAVELNESFAVQALACIQEMELDPTIVNTNGGALALGNPLGCSGSRIVTSLVHEMARNKSKYGLATMCAGLGQGSSIIIESIH